MSKYTKTYVDLFSKLNKLGDDNPYLNETEYQPELEGQRVELWYKPAQTSRNWRKSSVMMLAYSEIAYNHGLALMNQEGWHAVKWQPYNPQPPRKLQ